MATWSGVITNSGNSILTEWINEKTLNFDGAAAGQGTVPAQAMLAQTALISQKQTASLLGGEKVDAGVRLKIRITAPDTAYTLNQYGVWASVTGGKSTLIALFQLDDGILIPSKEESPDFVYTFYALIMCSNTGTWSVTVDTSVGVTVEDMQESISSAIATREERLMDASEKISLADGDSVAIVDSADNSKTKRVLWSTIKSALSKIYVPLTRKINNKVLSSDVTLTGTDIKVSESDDTKIDAALSNKVNAVPPSEFTLPTTETFTLSNRSVYWKNQFGEVSCVYELKKISGYISTNDILGILPIGYRPKGNVPICVVLSNVQVRETTWGTVQGDTGEIVIKVGSAASEKYNYAFGFFSFIAAD